MRRSNGAYKCFVTRVGQVPDSTGCTYFYLSMLKASIGLYGADATKSACIKKRKPTVN